MKIKQTIKLVLSGFVLTAGLATSIASPLFATTCGGVETSIVSCADSGACPTGENPYEGTDPGSDTTKQADYVTKYHHTYGVCKNGNPPIKTAESSSIWSLLLMVINILTAGVGVLAVGGIVYGSILYTSAGGSPDGVKKARGIITNVVIGILAYALMFALLNFIIPGGLLKP